MMGILIKDFYTLKNKAKGLLIFISFFLIWGIFMQNIDSLYSSLIFVPYFLMATNINSDERTNYTTFALTTPISRRALVLAKYVFALLLYGITGIFYFTITFFQNNREESWLLGSYLFVISLLLVCVMIPFWFKFGLEKSRILTFSIFIAFLAVPNLGNFLNFSFDLEAFIYKFPLFFLILVPVFICISLLCSFHIYQKKEF